MKLTAEKVSVRYGAKVAVDEVSMAIAEKRVTAFIGPSGCGKSTMLRCFNRMNDTVEGCVVSGQIKLDGEEILGAHVDVVELRRKIGMVFQKPNPFPKSIFDNVAFGPLLAGSVARSELDRVVEGALRSAGLWDETKDRLSDSAMALSGGQQQRLCIARALAVSPEVLLLDEPTSALDPIATKVIEELMKELSGQLTVVVVTHNLQQAKRIADETAFFYLGKLEEMAPSEQLFGAPQNERTKAYVQGAFG